MLQRQTVRKFDVLEPLCVKKLQKLMLMKKMQGWNIYHFREEQSNVSAGVAQLSHSLHSKLNTCFKNIKIVNYLNFVDFDS